MLRREGVDEGRIGSVGLADVNCDICNREKTHPIAQAIILDSLVKNHNGKESFQKRLFFTQLGCVLLSHDAIP